jgi:hypothetical protein
MLNAALPEFHGLKWVRVPCDAANVFGNVTGLLAHRNAGAL